MFLHSPLAWDLFFFNFKLSLFEILLVLFGTGPADGTSIIPLIVFGTNIILFTPSNPFYVTLFPFWSILKKIHPCGNILAWLRGKHTWLRKLKFYGLERGPILMIILWASFFNSKLLPETLQHCNDIVHASIIFEGNVLKECNSRHLE